VIKFRGGAGQGSGPTQPWLERLRKFMQFQRVFWVEGDDMDRSLGRITIHDAQLQTANCARKIRVVPMNIKPKAELFSRSYGVSLADSSVAVYS